ncbi:hypothetical protein [Rheinheimera sp. WS51]|uniref:hypothetical protein n=1 Tax=Rheinheimera sp. WS51 TaxID=3425886 RepID=UPI003D8C6A94
MSELDFDLDHLDFDTAEQNVQQQQEEITRAAAAEALQQNEDDDCIGGACKI